MGSNPPQPGNSPPPKPWERVGASSGPLPFKPPSSGSTSDVVEASGTAKPGEIVTNAARTTPANINTLGRPLPSRPWEQNYGNSYGGYGSNSGYGSNMNYNSGYGSGMYNSSYGGVGGSYGGGLYGNSMSRGYGGLYGGSGMYGGSMYNNGIGGPTMGGGYGMGMGGGGPYGDQDPNNPYGAPSQPPGFWMSLLRVMHGVVNFFGRISILVDQNTQAVHMFMSALLQLFDRSGLLYGELARFVLRVLGIRTKPRKQQPGHGGLPGPNEQVGKPGIEGPKGPAGSWENVWEDDDRRSS